MCAAPLVRLNGIDGTTGQYLVPPFERDELVERVTVDPLSRRWLERVADQAREQTWGLPYDRNPAVVAQAGWGVVFHQAEEPAVRAALAPLIEHRRRQVNNDRIVKELVYCTGDERAGWLAHLGVAPPTVDPERVPYYLLLVGDASRLPFHFAHQLSIDYAVGRLHFDTIEGYESYARSVIAYELSTSVDRQKTVTVFGTRHDEATRLSADSLLAPLARGSSDKPSVIVRNGFQVQEHIGTTATKGTLGKIISASEDHRPAMLFTATHGIGWPRDHPSQKSSQGALLCQEWHGDPLSPSDYFSAADVGPEARLHGLIAFHFACFSAGTPRDDRFRPRGAPPLQIADSPFLAALPQALLSHPQGGALACVGHVERAWGYSIESADAGPQLLPFENFLGKMLTGCPVGFAMKDFSEKYATVSTILSGLIEKREFQQIDDAEFAELWLERNDAEAYLIVGDPAIRLRIEAMEIGSGSGDHHA